MTFDCASDLQTGSLPLVITPLTPSTAFKQIVRGKDSRGEWNGRANFNKLKRKRRATGD
jgi:hypothetical protein